MVDPDALRKYPLRIPASNPQFPPSEICHQPYSAAELADLIRILNHFLASSLEDVRRVGELVMVRRLLAYIACLTLGLGLLFPLQASAADAKPFPGKESTWRGFARHDFQVDGTEVIVIEPKKAAAGRPWVWRAEFFDAFPNADVALVEQGWHLVYIRVPNLFGSPKAMTKWEAFHEALVNDYKLHPRPGLIGLSRGALYAMAWAARHPDKTLAVYLDNGVCDFKSWPGGKALGRGATGPGSAGEWKNVLAAFDFKDTAEAIAYDKNPVDHLQPLADAKIPLLLVYGDADKVVPHFENSAIVFERYRKLGGPVEQIVKPNQDHHPHGLTDPQPIVDFFEKALSADRSSTKTAP